MKNYIKVKNWVPFLSSYMYIDTQDHLADNIFLDHDMTFVLFGANELMCTDNEYCFVKCTIRTSQEDVFEECMEHLARKIQFHEYDEEDYEYLCSIFKLIETGEAELIVE